MVVTVRVFNLTAFPSQVKVEAVGRPLGLRKVTEGGLLSPFHQAPYVLHLGLGTWDISVNVMVPANPNLHPKIDPPNPISVKVGPMTADETITVKIIPFGPFGVT